MTKIIKIMAVVVAVFSLSLVLNSCEKRTLPVELKFDKGLDYTSSFNDTSSFWFNYLGDNTYRELSVYTPPGYSPTDTTVKYPILYLLHGFGGDQDYFTDIYGLNSIADELIAKSEIDPMIIATIDASSVLGGGFYTDSDSFGVITVIDTLYFNYTAHDPAGNPIDSVAVTDTNDVTRTFSGLFESLVIDQLKREIEANYNIYTDRAHTGIGGHSMGGYGAMKIAMKYPEIYGSVSSMSAPLAFNYLAGFVPSILAENGLSATNTDSVNEALFHNIIPSRSRSLTMMMLAMASVFSPHGFGDADSSHWVGLPIYDTLQTVIRVGVKLPFNWTCFTDPTLDTPIWAQWLEHDCLTMLPTYAPGFGNTAIYMDCGDNDELMLKLHSDAFDAALTAAGISHEYYVYSGYEGNPAGHSDYVAQRLREVLKFHSRNFQ